MLKLSVTEQKGSGAVLHFQVFMSGHSSQEKFPE